MTVKRFLRFADLAERGVPYTRVHIARLEAAGKFPRKVKMSENTVCWVEAEIEAWLADRMAARGAEAA